MEQSIQLKIIFSNFCVHWGIFHQKTCMPEEISLNIYHIQIYKVCALKEVISSGLCLCGTTYLRIGCWVQWYWGDSCYDLDRFFRGPKIDISCIGKAVSVWIYIKDVLSIRQPERPVLLWSHLKFCLSIRSQPYYMEPKEPRNST